MADTIKLLPCPFCGSDAHVRTAYASGAGHFDEVTCGNALCEAKSPNADTEEEAIAAWNRRANAPDTVKLREALEAARRIVRGFLECPEIADCAPEDKDPETDELERQARALLASAKELGEGD